MEKESFVYILANKRNGTLYTGVTSNLVKRVYEHKHDFVDGFSEKFKTNMLVYFEIHSDIKEAILREKQIKKWNRAWKLRIVEEINPEWKDLYQEIT